MNAPAVSMQDVPRHDKAGIYVYQEGAFGSPFSLDPMGNFLILVSSVVHRIFSEQRYTLRHTGGSLNSLSRPRVPLTLVGHVMS